MLDDAKSDMEEMEGLNCSTTPSVSLGFGLRPGKYAYPVIRHLNLAQLCNITSSHWGVEHDLLPMLHAGDGSLHWACKDQAENAATLTPMAWMGMPGVGGVGLHLIGQPLEESSISMIVEMGFFQVWAEETFSQLDDNSVEMAMEWLFSHPEEIL
ncbi:unnamed protein product [Sphagnum troendelagicum]|uniref:UBA domain-containing protein n=1 Tax=Sphagnum troendelagicum TaxID=128251 RepID=A0ABP0T7L6_9BRYO